MNEDTKTHDDQCAMADKILEGVQELQAELAQLRRWKAEAMEVMPDFQAIGKALGLPAGQTVHDKILLCIQALQAEVSTLRVVLEQYRDAFSDGPENCTFSRYEEVDHAATKALSSPPPPVVLKADAEMELKELREKPSDMEAIKIAEADLRSDAYPTGFQAGAESVYQQVHTVHLSDGTEIRVKGQYEPGDSSVGIQGGWCFVSTNEEELEIREKELRADADRLASQLNVCLCEWHCDDEHQANSVRNVINAYLAKHGKEGE